MQRVKIRNVVWGRELNDIMGRDLAADPASTCVRIKTNWSNWVTYLPVSPLSPQGISVLYHEDFSS